MKVVNIKLDKIEQNENSRVVYKNADLAELMSSMKKDGLLQPVGVRALDNGNYEAVFGNRRVLAAKKLDWQTIDAHVLEINSETDRDILGLVENFKRQNTSMAEDGRMFQLLKDRGLSVHEIAARLEVSLERVTAALEVLNAIPAEYHKRIVYSVPGGKKRVRDSIPASTAVAVMNVRKTHGLNREQTRSILNYAADSKPSVEQINKIGPFIKGGNSVAQAIELVTNLERVVLSVYIPRGVLMKLEKKYESKIHEIFYTYLRDNKEFKLEGPTKTGGVRHRLRKFAQEPKEIRN